MRYLGGGVPTPLWYPMWVPQTLGIQKVSKIAYDFFRFRLLKKLWAFANAPINNSKFRK